VSTQEKVIFRLERDEDGYPPVDLEGVWATRLGEDEYEVDNIPFFAKVALGDVVRTVIRDGEPHFESILKYSGNSLIRVVYYDGTDPTDVRRELERLGAETELNATHRLIAVNVPRGGDVAEIQKFLGIAEQQERLGYEEPILWDGPPEDGELPEE
jgi:hypothetical protein